MRHLPLRLAAAVLVFVLLSAPLQAQPALSGPEVRVLRLSADSWWLDFNPLWMVAHPEGEVTVLWRDVPASAIWARRFDARGRALGSQIRVGPDGWSIGVAPLGDGFVVVGLQEEAGGPFNRMRIFDGDGRPRREPFPVDTPETAANSELRVASDARGDFAVAWSGKDARTGLSEIFLRRFSAAGVPRGEPWRVPRPGSPRGAGGPSVAMAPDGEILVVWSEGGQIFGQRVGRFGNPRGAPFCVSSRRSATSPAAVFTSTGDFLVAWGGFVNDDGRASTGLWARRYDNLGRARGGRFRVDFGGADFRGSGAPPLLVPSAHGAVVAFLGGLSMREIRGDGSLGPELALGLVRPRARSPMAAAGWENGDLAVVSHRIARAGWMGRDLVLQRFATEASPGELRFALGRAAAPERDGQIRVRVERREGNRGAVSAVFKVLARSARPGEDFRPISGRVSFADGDSTPRLLTLPVLDDALPEGDETLVLALSDPSGGAVLGSPAQVRMEIRDDDAPPPLLGEAGEPFEIRRTWETVRAPSVSALAGGSFLFTWEHEDRSYWEPWLESALYAPDGAEISRWTWPEARAATGRACAQPGGGFVLTCDGFTAGSIADDPEPTGAVGQRFDALGRPVTTVFDLPSAPEALAPGPPGGFLALSLEPAGEDLAVYVAAHGHTGRRLGPPSRVDGTPAFRGPLFRGDLGPDPGPPVALAAAAERGGVVAWRSALDDGDRILARRIDALGYPLGPEIAVAAQPGRLPDRPAVALLPGGGFVVVWEDADGEGSGIFARRFDASGQPAGEIVQVNSRTAGDQVFPRVAVETGGRFLVLWETPGASGRWRLEGQLFAADGARLGSSFALDAGAARTREQTEVAVAADPAGGFITAWVEWGRERVVLGRRLRAPAE